MADAIFDKEGTITNLEELSVDEVAGAYKAKNKEIYDARVAESEARKIAKEEAEQARKDLAAEREKHVAEVKAAVAPTPQSDPDELRLMARGLSDEEIDQAKVLAKGNGTSLAEAIKSPLFKLYQENLKEEARKESAKLGASSGSGQQAEELGANKPDLSKDDHKAVWKKALGRG